MQGNSTRDKRKSLCMSPTFLPFSGRSQANKDALRGSRSLRSHLCLILYSQSGRHRDKSKENLAHGLMFSV